MDKTILNIASGKIPITSIDEDRYFIVNLDPMYLDAISAKEVEQEYTLWTKTNSPKANKKVVYCNEKAYEFMERTKIKFNGVCIYRFLEHVSFNEIEYFIYLISTITTIGAIVDVIVPNYKVLAQMILDENTASPNFYADNILLTTELLNEVYDPHKSIWTLDRAIHFWTLEKRFMMYDAKERHEFDGRDIYLNFKAKRISSPCVDNPLPVRR